MRYLLCLLLTACGHIAHFEPINEHPATCEESATQLEMRCLENSSTDHVMIPIGLFIVSGGTDGTVVARHCQLQGQLSLMRCLAAHPAASAPAGG